MEDHCISLDIVFFISDGKDIECANTLQIETLPHKKRVRRVFVRTVDEAQSVVESSSSDYLFFVPSGFVFSYDAALEDALSIVEGTDLVCFGTSYEADKHNKYDVHWRHPLLSPSLRSIIDSPGDFIATLFSRKVLIDYKLKGENCFEASIITLLHCVLTGRTYEFVALNILSSSESASKINRLIDKKRIEESVLLMNPVLSSDLQFLFNMSSDDTISVLQKIERSIFFRCIMKLRNWMKIVGYYRIKSQIKHSQYIKRIRNNDAQRVISIEKSIKELPLNLLSPKGDESDIIVSLTTHGNRFSESAPYAIYSLFTQSVKPGRIIICVDEDKWNNDNLPSLIKRLQRSGLEVLFCRDVRSHTKLLPVLEKYPNNPIITVDDDILYETHMIENLVAAFNNSDKKTVLCRRGVFPEKKNGKYISYMNWVESSVLNSKSALMKHPISPFGVSGVLYPPHVFDPEVFNSDVFLKIAPHTDDIWFWVHELRCGVNTQLINYADYSKDKSVKEIEYLIEEESSALYFQNCFEGRNDKEMYALLEYYKLS